MQLLDPIEVWLNNVAVAHSNSERTANKYKGNLQEFCNFIGKTPQQMLEEYENYTDREFKKKYTQYLRAYISHLFKRELAPNTIRCTTGAIRSFFKYNDLPLGHIPSARVRVIHHNREITRKEVVQIIEASGKRERAFYAIMAQSGLRPHTLTQLKFSHIKEDFDKEDNKSYVIYVPQEVTKGKYIPYFTFIGKYAMDKLRAYLRPGIQEEDYIFTKQGTEEPANSRSISSLFLRTVLELHAKDKIKDLKQKERGKPHNVRLYNLRKFFRKYGGRDVDATYVNFWMGHRINYKAPQIPASDEHYFSKQDVEFHRKKFEEEALPHLRLETATPNDQERTIKELEIKVNELLEIQANYKDSVIALLGKKREYAEELMRLYKGEQLWVEGVIQMKKDHDKKIELLEKRIEELEQKQKKK